MVSVILPIYNGAKYIEGCINSILEQTYDDFELLIMDDGSTDDSVQIAESFNDPRIKIFKCKHNFINTLNRGIRVSKGEFIARMDCDDLMVPDRLKLQVEAMEQDSNMAVCGSWAQTFGLAEQMIGMGSGKIAHPLLTFLRGNFVIHPSVMMRRSFLLEHNIRYKKYPYAEDYKMWADISNAGGDIFIISKPLVMYRVSESQVTVKFHECQQETATRIRQEILETLLKHNNYKSELIYKLYDNMVEANCQKLIDADTIFLLFHQIFTTMAGIVDLN